MLWRWVCGVVAVAMIFSSQGWTAPAMAKQPADSYDEEFWAGEIGAVAGGAVVFVAGLGTALVIPEVGWWALYGFPATPNWWFLALWSVGMGRAVGAGIGVISAGESSGVHGNVIMAYLLPGVFLSVYPITSLLGLTTDLTTASLTVVTVDLTATPHLPFIPAVLAVIGYNIGAKMKDTGQPASLPWTLDLPVLSLEF